VNNNTNTTTIIEHLAVESNPIILAILVVLIIAVVVLVILLISKKKKKEEVPRELPKLAMEKYNDFPERMSSYGLPNTLPTHFIEEEIKRIEGLMRNIERNVDNQYITYKNYKNYKKMLANIMVQIRGG